MNERDRLIELLTKLRDAIRAKMEQEGENATGNTSRSFEVEDYGKGVRLVGGGKNCAPLFTLEKGRPSGGVPYAGIFYDWSVAKGLNFPTDRERWSFAWAVREKIKNEGTDRHKNNVDIFTSLTAETIAEAETLIGYIVDKFLKV